MKILNIAVAMAMLVPMTVALASDTDDMDATKQGVYEYVVRASQMDLDEATRLLEKQFVNSSFQVIANLDAAVSEGCTYRARVIVAYDHQYAKALLDINRLTAPFAVADRISLFEDEMGLHIAIVNSANINRTILMDDEQYTELSLSHKSALRDVILAAGIGEESHHQFGKFRKKGYIGRTFGIMAGGSFDDKIKDVAVLPDADFAEVVKKLSIALKQAEGGDWGLNFAYAIVAADDAVAVLGATGDRLERKSFAIVKAGSDKARKKLQCPGIAHAAGYPIEMVVVQEDGVVKVRLVNIMYRMKMYFEDAGKMAFAKNMGMPGSIQDELEDLIEVALNVEQD